MSNPEPLIRLLAELPSAEPDAARASRIQARCRAQLGRRAPRAAASPGPGPWRRTLQIWEPLLVVLGVAYLTEALVEALRLYGGL